ncbi:MAG: hypothetical protein GX815_00740, partial [Clostridiales bacterium]|nr:hypothetical protein [Clostridiales bacterium]
IKELEEENRVLKSEIQRLNILLEKAAVYNVTNKAVQPETSKILTTDCIVNENITTEQIDLFITLFRGRTDVYAVKMKDNLKEVKIGLGRKVRKYLFQRKM